MRVHRPAGAANPADAIDGEGEILLQMRVPALAERLKDVRDAVRTAVLDCGCSDAIAGDIVIAVGEACQNIVRHAYADEPDGEFIVEIRRDGDAVVVLLRDFAKVVDPDRASARESWTICAPAGSAPTSCARSWTMSRFSKRRERAVIC